MVINLDSVKYTILSLFQMEWLLSYRIINEQYYKWQLDWAANQVTVRFDGAVTYLANSIVCLTKCNSKIIVDYYYFINYYNYDYFQNEIYHYYYYYCEKCITITITPGLFPTLNLITSEQHNSNKKDTESSSSRLKLGMWY